MKIIYSSKFAREYKELPLKAKLLAEKQELVFRQNPFDLQLNTHKLKGKFKNFFSFSISYQYRIIFEFSKESDTVYFHAVGNHDIYR